MLFSFMVGAKMADIWSDTDTHYHILVHHGGGNKACSLDRTSCKTTLTEVSSANVLLLRHLRQYMSGANVYYNTWYNTPTTKVNFRQLTV